MDTKVYITIILMALVTYLPRMFPMVMLGGRTVNGFWDRVLKLIPVATLTALIVPAGFSATSNPITSIAGLAAAVVLSLLKCSLIVIVLGSVGTAVLAGMIL